jgi:hypothetical protein
LENLKGKDHLEDPGRDGKIKCILRNTVGLCGRINLAHDRRQWLALVNTVMNFQVTKRRVIFLLDERLLASQDGLCYMETYLLV